MNKYCYTFFLGLRNAAFSVLRLLPVVSRHPGDLISYNHTIPAEKKQAILEMQQAVMTWKHLHAS